MMQCFQKLTGDKGNMDRTNENSYKIIISSKMQWELATFYLDAWMLLLTGFCTENLVTRKQKPLY